MSIDRTLPAPNKLASLLTPDNRRYLRNISRWLRGSGNRRRSTHALNLLTLHIKLIMNLLTLSRTGYTTNPHILHLWLSILYRRLL